MPEVALKEAITWQWIWKLTAANSGVTHSESRGTEFSLQRERTDSNRITGPKADTVTRAGLIRRKKNEPS